MKKILMFFGIALLLYSCNDVVNSDPNYNQILKKGIALENQSDGVIMPLAVGNYWHYNFTEYDTLGNLIETSIDTIEIKKNSIVDDSTWYNARESGADSVYFINTESGLWYKCSGCDDDSHLIAPYPVENNFTHNAWFETYQVIYENEDGSFSEDYVTTAIRIKCELDVIINVNGTQYNTIKYSLKPYFVDFGESEVRFAKEIEWETYYVPDLGKVYEERYVITSTGRKLEYKKELRNYKLF